MKNAKIFLSALLLGCFLAAPAAAQYQLGPSVVGNGGGLAAGSHRIDGTVGQAAVGITTSTTRWHQAGFWISSSAVSGVEFPTGLPAVYRLDQNHPNPFNPKTTINYALPEEGRVKLTLYDIRGRLVRTLVDTNQPAGFHRVELDGRGLASGVYFCKLQASSFHATRKMTLLK